MVYEGRKKNNSKEKTLLRPGVSHATNQLHGSKTVAYKACRNFSLNNENFAKVGPNPNLYIFQKRMSRGIRPRVNHAKNQYSTPKTEAYRQWTK